MKNLPLLRAFTLLAFFLAPLSNAESQGSDYKGIVDPFGDPTAYEFAEDEKLDKEFFHLGRFLMLGMDVGLGSFTGELGANIEAGVYAGAHLIYFFDKSLGFEARGAFAKHLGVDPSLDSILIPINFGFRFYPDIKSAPKPIALANPYLTLGGGLYINRSDVEGLDESTNNFGGYLGGGIEFLIYRRHIYLGADFRYHLISFEGEEVEGGSGDYFTSLLTLTYNY